MSEIDTPSKADALARIKYRTPCARDGLAIWRAVQAAGTLDVNSAYFYLIFSTDFSQTCLVALDDDQIAGLVIGYQPPGATDTAFCWQIGVLPDWQGLGLGKRLLAQWLALPANRHVRWLTATVAEDNSASERLFRGFARTLGAPCEVKPHFTEDLLAPGHAPEPMYRIGPFDLSVALGDQLGSHTV